MYENTGFYMAIPSDGSMATFPEKLILKHLYSLYRRGQAKATMLSSSRFAYYFSIVRLSRLNSTFNVTSKYQPMREGNEIKPNRFFFHTNDFNHF